MGRAKLKMELIEKEKPRNTTFKKRKEGLIRKLNEFTTLCDVNACMIIYGPNQSRPEIWPPENPEQVQRIIELYKSKNSAGIKTMTVQDFFKERQKQIEEEVNKLRRKNLEAKYPTHPDLINSFNEPHLRKLHAILTDKANCVRSRIELIKMKQQQHRSHVDMVMNPQLEMHHLRMHHHMYNNPNFQLQRQLYFESASGYYAPPPQPYYMVQQYLANQEELLMRNQSARVHNHNQDGGVQYDIVDVTTNKMFFS